MDGAGAHPGGGIAAARPSRDVLGWVLPFATALVIVVASVLLLTTRLWMHFAIPAAGGGIPRLTAEQSLRVSDDTVFELISSGYFSSITDDDYVPIYMDTEAAHLRDARTLLRSGIVLAILSAVLVFGALIHRANDARRWKAVARGGAGLAVGAVIVGLVGYFAFDALFEIFHRVFFPQGNWEFPADSNMIRLYPFAFWQLTAAALGVLCLIGGGAVWFVARRRARALA